MENGLPGNELISLLSQMYKMNDFSRMMDFCQGEIRILVFLDELKESGCPSPSDIAKELGITKGRVTAALRSLKSKEFVKTEVSKNDRRKQIVSLTSVGKDYISARRSEVEAFISTFVKKLGPKRTADFIDCLREATK